MEAQKIINLLSDSEELIIKIMDNMAEEMRMI